MSISDSSAEPCHQWLTVAQCCAQLAVKDRDLILQEIHAGRLIAVDISHGKKRSTWRVSQVELNAWLNARKSQPPTTPAPRARRSPAAAPVREYFALTTAEDNDRSYATHEAGHAVMAHVMGYYDISAWIVESPQLGVQAGGCVHTCYGRTAASDIPVQVAGLVAEHILYDHWPEDLAGSLRGDACWGSEGWRDWGISESDIAEFATLRDADAEQAVADLVYDTLEHNWHVVERIAERLISQRSVEADEMERLLAAVTVSDMTRALSDAWALAECHVWNARICEECNAVELAAA